MFELELTVCVAHLAVPRRFLYPSPNIIAIATSSMITASAGSFRFGSFIMNIPLCGGLIRMGDEATNFLE